MTPKPKRIAGIRYCDERPPGYRNATGVVEVRPDSVKIKYYDHELWVPKRAMRYLAGEELIVQAWAIDSAKNYAATKHLRDVRNKLNV